MTDCCAKDTSRTPRTNTRRLRMIAAAQSKRTCRPAELRELLEATVASGFDIDEVDLRIATRGQARIALARQVAMYLAHVACGMSKTEVGLMFQRDRTTVHHACLLVELRRDDDCFNEALDHLERVITIVVGPGEASCPYWI